MSRNDQILIKKHEGKFYVFSVMAESWKVDGETNPLKLTRAIASFPTREEALVFAHDLDVQDSDGGTEYGVHEERLCKDGAEVTIKTSPQYRND